MCEWPNDHEQAVSWSPLCMYPEYLSLTFLHDIDVGCGMLDRSGWDALPLYVWTNFGWYWHLPWCLTILILMETCGSIASELVCSMCMGMRAWVCVCRWWWSDWWLVCWRCHGMVWMATCGSIARELVWPFWDQGNGIGQWIWFYFRSWSPNRFFFVFQLCLFHSSARSVV